MRKAKKEPKYILRKTDKNCSIFYARTVPKMTIKFFWEIVTGKIDVPNLLHDIGKFKLP